MHPQSAAALREGRKDEEGVGGIGKPALRLSARHAFVFGVRDAAAIAACPGARGGVLRAGWSGGMILIAGKVSV